MLYGKIFHPENDIFCRKDCVSNQKLTKDQFLDDKPVFYGNSCQLVRGPHPLDKAGIDALHFEFGKATDEESEKLRFKRLHEYRERE
jgi:hypothetical protein